MGRIALIFTYNNKFPLRIFNSSVYFVISRQRGIRCLQNNIFTFNLFAFLGQDIHRDPFTSFMFRVGTYYISISTNLQAVFTIISLIWEFLLVLSKISHRYYTQSHVYFFVFGQKKPQTEVCGKRFQDYSTVTVPSSSTVIFIPSLT